MGSEQNIDRWAAYDRWNAALAQVVYGPDSAGLPVFLDMEESVLARVADLVGVDERRERPDLKDAVRSTMDPPTQRGGAFRSHLARLRSWKSRGDGTPPPVIALLALMSLAAEEMAATGGLAANNYYDRLMPLLAISDAEEKRRLVNAYRRCSEEVWEALNHWLDDSNGERGLPTAYSYSHRHIGRPLSQALVRATDRRKLGELFEELGFPPHARVSPLDMELLLAEWIGRNPSPASKGLRALWKRPAARDRITPMACQLLENWVPTSAVTEWLAGQPSRPTTLRLVALLGSLPPSVEIGMSGPGEPPVDLAYVGASTEPPVPLGTEALAGGRWRFTDPELFESASLLSGHVALTAPNGALYERRPRRLVPCMLDHLAQTYIEVERLALGEDALLLCHEGLTPAVSRALEVVALRGWREWGQAPAGLPSGWTLFSGVQVMGGLPHVDTTTDAPWPDDLNALQPLSTSQIVLNGGFQLPGQIRRWSTLAPPEVRIVTDTEQGLTMGITQVRAFSESVDSTTTKVNGPVAVHDLRHYDLPDGDYEVQIANQGGRKVKVLHQARVRLRSAEVPPTLPPPEPRLTHDLESNALAVLSASRSTGRGIRGLDSPGKARTLQLAETWTDSMEPRWWARRHEDRDAVIAKRRVIGSRPNEKDCFETGAHHEVLPTDYGTGSNAWIMGECVMCGLKKRYPPRGRLRRTSSGSKDLPSFDVTLTPIATAEHGSLDVAFDALCHDLAGNGYGLEQVALQVECSRLFVDEFVRALEVMGHIEVDRDPKSLRVREWEVLEPTLCKASSGRFFLVGVRSDSLITMVGNAASRAGSLLCSAASASSPRQWWLENCDEEKATDIWVALNEEGVQFNLVVDAADRLALRLPPLSEVVAALPRQPMSGYHHASIWDGGSARWQTVGDASTPGAYRLDGAGRVYCVRDLNDVATGTMRRGDARLIKHADALRRSEGLTGYRRDHNALYVPLGADLPGLYGRAIASCAGFPPVPDKAQRALVYHHVPEGVAATISALLST